MDTSQLDPQKQAILDRGRKFNGLVNAEGFQDLLALSAKCRDGALDELRTYDGADKEKIFALYLCWKSLDHHHTFIVSTIQGAINEAKAILSPQAVKAPEAVPGTGIVPQCVLENQ